MRNALFLALVLLVSASSGLGAQDVEPGEWVAPGYLTHAAPISQAQARTRCPRIASRGCRPVEMVDLGMAGGRRWYVGIYQAVVADTFPDRATRDSMIYSRQEETMVVYSAARKGGPLRPEWQGAYFPTWFADVVPEVGDAPGGGTLLAIMVCYNGTAGCGSQFLKISRAGAWHSVRQPWVDALPRPLRTFARGAFVTPRTLTVQTGLWADRYSDPGPGKQRYLVARLAWRGSRTLVLRSYRVTSRDPFAYGSYVPWRKSQRDYDSDWRPLRPHAGRPGPPAHGQRQPLPRSVARPGGPPRP